MRLTKFYHQDDAKWTEQTAELLKVDRFSELDIEH
jgi:hypothetical protein